MLSPHHFELFGQRLSSQNSLGVSIWHGRNIWNIRLFWRVAVPNVPLAEQEEIVEMELVGGHPSLDLLAEHRQALITAAVTGELRMPGVAV